MFLRCRARWGGIKLWNAEGKAVDLNSTLPEGGIPRPNGWGRNEESFYKLNWLHSDMKDMAYFYVFRLYDQLIQKGILK